MTRFLQNWFEANLSALVYSLVEEISQKGQSCQIAQKNRAVRFALLEIEGMTDFLRFPVKALLLAFDILGLPESGRVFHLTPPGERGNQISRWRNSPFPPFRDLIRLFENLAVLGGKGWKDEPEPVRPSRISRTTSLRAQTVVIGSGPGGAITACLLAEAGHDVILLEEGSAGQTESPPFSVNEIREKYRCGGLTPALGRSKIAYAEGRCLGGGSEVNSGLYHRTPKEILAAWQRIFRADGLGEEILEPLFEANERELSVGCSHDGGSPASRKLKAGADAMGWHALEVPRWFRYEAGSTEGVRQSMSRTFLPRATEAGCRVLSGIRASHLALDGRIWSVFGRDGKSVCRADSVFLCAGAIHTPALLRRSHITRNVGKNLQMHPTLKVVALFPDEVNREDMGVPVHQVKEFSPHMSFGCSISSVPFLASAMINYPNELQMIDSHWRRMAVYYVMITPAGRGSVVPLPGFQDPLVRFSLERSDLAHLADGIRKLCECLFAAGAEILFPGIDPPQALRKREDIARLPDELPHGQPGLMTIHLFSSCSMGENRALCAADSFGRIPGRPGLRISDASLLCSAPGVNPQGTVMAIARRNALHFLGEL